MMLKATAFCFEVLSVEEFVFPPAPFSQSYSLDINPLRVT